MNTSARLALIATIAAASFALAPAAHATPAPADYYGCWIPEGCAPPYTPAQPTVFVTPVAPAPVVAAPKPKPAPIVTKPAPKPVVHKAAPKHKVVRHVVKHRKPCKHHRHHR